MPTITLPDQSTKSFDHSVSALDVAASIGPGLAKATLAAIVDGELVDASHIIEGDATLSIITIRDKEGLDVVRHSTAHLLAQATKQMFPEAEVTIGPVIENGFYYDFAYLRGFTPGNIETIEKRMKELVAMDLPITRKEMKREEAIALFSDMGEKYKVSIIEDIPEGETISLYQQGDFIDLCRGPHVPSTGKLKVFKLTKVAGAYWRGDAKNEMLQRIYGTAWRNKKDLRSHLFRLEEASKRDHRKLARQLDFFHMQEEAPGMVFWHANGWHVYQEIKRYIRQVLFLNGYEEINTPQLVDMSLWHQSGHADKFGDAMFSMSHEEREYAIKPMNCPCHVQVFNQGLKSYRDLPLRLAEFGSCHRHEPSGTLQGLMRVRGFVQDDAHIFCKESDVENEVTQFIDLLFKVYKDFGFENITIKLSTRPNKRVGSDEVWDKAEQALASALDAKNLKWEYLPGEGAFYGPKIEFTLYDCLDRAWQCGTIQVDFSMPGRLNAKYVAEDGSKQVPVMLHRAILGSFERFIGILIEQHAGALPTWLAPKQAIVLSITDFHKDFCQKIEKSLRNKGFSVVSDLRNEKIGFKIREHVLQKVPYLLIVGDREVEKQTVSVRSRFSGDLGSMSLTEFESLLNEDISRRSRVVSED